MKHMALEKVQIKSIDWYNANKDESGDIITEDNAFISHMSKYCGQTATITRRWSFGYELDIDGGDWYWFDDCLEDVVK